MHTQLHDSFEKAAPQPTSEPDYEALWRRGRRMRRTRFSLSMAAVASITALVAVSVQTGMFSGILSRENVGAASRGLPSAPSRENLFIAGIDRESARPGISFTDLATGETSSTEIADFSPGDARSPLTVSGESLVYLGPGGVYSTPTDLSRSPEKIGSAAYFSPAFVDGRVWLALYDESLPDDSGWLGRLQEVSADDGTLITDVTLPRAQWTSLVGEVSSGLVFEDDGAITVWDFSEREVVLKIEHAFLLSLQGDLIAWYWCETTNCPEELTVVNVATGEELTVSPPDGHGFAGGSSAFSPDGRYLATTVNTQGGDRRFALVHVATGAIEVIPELGRGGAVAWSSSSDKVYVAGEEQLLAYQPETKRIDVVSSGLPPDAFAIVAGGL